MSKIGAIDLHQFPLRCTPERPMKINSTVAFTAVLLALMVGAGLVSATWGMAIGREALKGITQPDTRPTNNLTSRQGGNSRQSAVAFFKEDDIIARVKTRIGIPGKSGTGIAAPVEPKAAPAKAEVASNSQFPLVSQSQDVRMEIKAVQRRGEDLVLQVNLQNNSKQSVRFLYSFLNITDEKGRAVSASTEGLPTELAAGSETFSGTINIPTALLDGVSKLSLNLTDYPDQRLQLQLSNIPVK